MLADRVKETTTTTGTGTVDLGGAAAGFRTFVAGMGGGNTCRYVIASDDGSEWEVGIGTVTDAATDTLSRDTVLSSSNGGSLVNFSVGTKDVFVDADASYLLAKVNESRSVNSGTGLTGGGDLSADRTLALTGQSLALHNLGTSGLIARTGVGTVAGRTLAAGTGISVTNGNGVSGNPTVAASLASQAQAEAGIDNTTLMTPALTKAAIDHNSGGLSLVRKTAVSTSVASFVATVPGYPDHSYVRAIFSNIGAAPLPGNILFLRVRTDGNSTEITSNSYEVWAVDSDGNNSYGYSNKIDILRGHSIDSQSSEDRAFMIVDIVPRGAHNSTLRWTAIFRDASVTKMVNGFCDGPGNISALTLYSDTADMYFGEAQIWAG